jgi:phage N-6-adenine-methyltransferase
MGSIDLDPASSDVANKTVMATEFYNEDDDGLTKDWYGNVWLNPPYSQPQISKFSDAVVAKRGQYESAVVLVNNATETQWLQQMMNVCDAMCFIHGRIKFLDVNGVASGAPLQGQCVLYFGKQVDAFITQFKGFGICMVKA